MRRFYVAGFVLFTLTFGAAASDMPDMKGVWTRTASTSAQINRNVGDPAAAKPSLSNGTGEGWKINIDAQDGRAFSGTLIDAAGKSYGFVGAFGDSEHFVFATDKDSGWGEIKDKDKMEYCWNAFSPSFVGAGCVRFERGK